MITDTSPKYSGEPTAKSLATGLATLGRYGDDYMVHAAEGETFVPKEILEANPELKENLFRQMTMMGIENPNRYVVGNELNSINPITGQPEFFFKKVFSAIKKVAKKVLPVAVPAIANYLVPGSGPLASALFTKTQGGSWGDAAKAGALSYVSSAIGRGFQDGFSLDPATNVPGSGGPFDFLDRVNFSTQGFGEGFQSGLMEPINAASNIFSSGLENPIAQGALGPRGANLFFKGAPGAEQYAKLAMPFFPRYQSSPAGIDSLSPRAVPQRQPTNTAANTSNDIDQMVINQTSGQPIVRPVRTSTSPMFDEEFDNIFRPGETPSLFASSGEGVAPENLARFAGKGEPVITSAKAGIESLPSGVTQKGDKFFFDGKEVVRKAADVPKGFEKIPEEGILSSVARNTGEFISGGNLTGTGAKVLGGAALAGGALFAANALMPEEEAFDESTLRTNIEKNAYNQWQNIADKNSPEAESLRTVWYGKPRYSASQQKSYFGSNPLAGITAVAAGGEIMGPGTGTSDSIPARLSDGEFVMTARAVRNAGNGNRDLGAARMYDMMNRFESGAA